MSVGRRDWSFTEWIPTRIKKHARQIHVEDDKCVSEESP